MRELMIDSIGVGAGRRPFTIAEMSGNHNGDLQRALDIVRAAAEAGASAIKLQTYTADTLTLDVDRPEFRISSAHDLWGGRSLYDLYVEASTPWEWHEAIFAEAASLGVIGFSTPFDPTSIDFLEGLGVPAYKIASSEIVDLPLIRCAAETGKPLIISTGMATLEEIAAALRTAHETGNDQVAILKCSASYPAPISESNLLAIPVLRQILDVEVGYSDHTPGLGVAVAAVALGASIVEKHMTVARADGGVDAQFSLEPHEFASLVRECAAARDALGQSTVGPTEAEREGLRLRRSLWVTQDTRAGELVSPENVRSLRPAGGMPPEDLDKVLGRPFRESATAGTPLTWDLV